MLAFNPKRTMIELKFVLELICHQWSVMKTHLFWFPITIYPNDDDYHNHHSSKVCEHLLLWYNSHSLFPSSTTMLGSLSTYNFRISLCLIFEILDLHAHNVILINWIGFSVQKINKNKLNWFLKIENYLYMWMELKIIIIIGGYFGVFSRRVF